MKIGMKYIIRLCAITELLNSEKRYILVLEKLGFNFI